MCLPPFPDIHSGRNPMCCPVHRFKINRPVPEMHRIHSAPDVHTDNIRTHFVRHCHRGSDSAAGSGMHVGHYADAASLSQFIVAHAGNLLNGLFFDHGCIAQCRVHFSLNLQHTVFLSAPSRPHAGCANGIPGCPFCGSRFFIRMLSAPDDGLIVHPPGFPFPEKMLRIRSGRSVSEASGAPG